MWDGFRYYRPGEHADPEWWAEVAGQSVAGYTVSRHGELEDEYGNFVLRLPKIRPADLEEWVNENISDDVGD